MRIITSVLLVLYSLISQANSMPIDKYTTKQGLSQNSINCIFQDSEGYMWFGTNDGLNKFDAYEFSTIRPVKNSSNSLSSLPVTCICEDKRANLWLAYADDYLDLYNIKTGKIQQLSIKGNYRPDIRNIYNFNNEIWLNSTTGIYKASWKNDSLNFVEVVNFADSSLIINSLTKFNNNVWANTSLGTLKIKETASNSTYELTLNRIGSNYFTCHSLAIWDKLVTSKYFGVFLINDNNLNQLIIRNKALCLLIDSKNNLWIGTKKGLYKYKSTSNDDFPFELDQIYREGLEQSSLSSSFISQLYEDSFGNIWIGTDGGGVNKLNPRKQQFQHYYNTNFKGGISNNQIHALLYDSKGNLWLGLSDEKIAVLPHFKSYDFANGFTEFIFKDPGIDYKIYGLSEFTFENSTYVTSSLAVYNQSHSFIAKDKKIINAALPKEFYNIQNPICKIIDDEHIIWIATYGKGLFRFNKKTRILENVDIMNGISIVIRTLMLDTHKNLWVATDKGLHRISAQGRFDRSPKIASFANDKKNPNSLSHNYVLPILESSSGAIWIGTLGGGLNKFIGNENGFELIDTENGLPNNVIKAIIEDDSGRLWVSTNKGISVIDTTTLDIQNFDEDDGLQAAEFSEFVACKFRNGHLLFGGINGFNIFDPNKVLPDTSKPRLVFTKLKVLNKTITPDINNEKRQILDKLINSTNEIRLRHNENNFTLFFAGIHFNASKKIKYRYKLEGVDNDWITASPDHRFANYSRVKYGKYKLLVNVSNADGKWTPVTKQLTISIKPPLTKTLGAYIIYFIIVLILVVLYQQYIQSKNKAKQELVMANFEKERLKELNAEKLKFFTNISHEFRTPLAIINSYLEKIKESLNPNQDLAIKKDLSIANRNSKVLLRLVNQLMDFRKIDQGKMTLKVAEYDIVKFVREIAIGFAVLAEEKNISYIIRIPDESINLWFDPSAMEKIIYNVLGNAIKYTPQNGKINISCYELQDEVQITIEDTGIGIRKDRREKIFERFYQSDRVGMLNNSGTGIGLSLTKGLVDLHQGLIELESEVNKGAKFTLTFLKGNRHCAQNIKVNNKIKYMPAMPIENIQEMVEKKTETHCPVTQEKKLLVVEDNDELRDLIKHSFHDRFEILEAENGKIGLNICKEQMPDMVISDVMMPIMDGFVMCESIKSNVAICHIPVILLTAKTTDENQLAGFKSGAEAYVTKPFNIQVLKSQVESIFTSRAKTLSFLKEIKDKNLNQPILSKLDKKLLDKINTTVAENIHLSSFTVKELCSECGLSYFVLNKKLQQLFDVTALQYIRNQRIKKAGDLLKSKMYNVSEIAFEVGFEDVNYFRKCFKDYFGVTPKKYSLSSE